MPKAKVERVVSDNGTLKTVEVEVGERGTTKTAQYTVPATPQAFQEMILGLSPTFDGGTYAKLLFGPDRDPQDEAPLMLAYRLFVSSIDRTARASVYESLAAESTLITVGKEKVDILTFPSTNLINAINGMRTHRIFKLEAMGAEDGDVEAEKVVDRSIGYGPWRTAARKLCEGYVNDKGEKVPPQAKENTSTGMLEPLAA